MKYSKRVSSSLKDSFMAKFLVDPVTDCWNWTAALTESGYGKLRRGGRTYKAHRLSYEMFVGPIPEHDSHHGMCVLHRCDNPQCVNPEHLFLGTNLDNIEDMRQKDRDSKGEQRYNAKLTATDIEDIKKDSRFQWQIAESYGITQPQVSKIKNGRRWKHTI